MIVRMKKLLLMCSASSQDVSLEALRELGVVHVNHIRMPESNDLDKARKRLIYVARALETLPKKPDARPSGQSTENVISELWKLIQEREHLEETLENLEHERDRIRPFGQFEPENIKALQKYGIKVKFYKIGATKNLPRHEDSVAVDLGEENGEISHVMLPREDIKRLAARRGLQIKVLQTTVERMRDSVLYENIVVELSRDRKGIYFAMICKGEIDVKAEEVRIPEMSLKKLEETIADTHIALKENEQKILGFAGDRLAVAGIVDDARAWVRYLEIRQGMGGDELDVPVKYLSGYFPHDAEEKIVQTAPKFGWGYKIEEPDEDDQPPTLLKNPKWVQPIKNVFSMIGIVPGYHELDVSMFFLVFLSIFFAMLVGDAGYGMLFLCTTLLFRHVIKSMPVLLYKLLMIMSICTIIWGTITGTWFGMDRGDGFLFQVDWLVNDKNIMFLCFLIGAIHLTIAHVWGFIRNAHSFKKWEQVGWLCMVWFMFLLALNMILGYSYTTLPLRILWYAASLAGVAGASLILAWLVKKKDWINIPMLPLTLIGSFTDVVSYVRLFAVGAASYAVANAFNQMAIGEGISNFWAGLGAAVILFCGHTLNIALAIMGVLVHGIRLNTLEFTSHLGMEWTGVKYQPFKGKSTQNAEAS